MCKEEGHVIPFLICGSICSQNPDSWTELCLHFVMDIVSILGI